MSIRIVMRKTLICPVVICDQCQQEITDGKDGNYEWPYVADGPADVFFTHNGCSAAFRAAHPEVKGSGKLTVFPLYLGNNLRIDHSEAQKNAENLAQF